MESQEEKQLPQPKPAVQQTSLSKPSFNLWMLSIFALLVAFLGTSLYYFVNQKTAPSPTSSPTQQSQPINQPPSPTPNPTSNLTENWQTYKDNKFGFEVKYPPEWKAWEPDLNYFPEAEFWLKIGRKRLNLPWSSADPHYPWLDRQDYKINGVELIVTKPKNIIDLDREGYNCNTAHEGCMFLFKYTQTSFKNIPARLTSAEFPDITNDPVLRKNFEGVDITPYSYFTFEKNGMLWIISYNHSDFKQNYNPTYDQILSTFQFTN